MPLEAVENHVRCVAPRRWIFSEVLERHLQAIYHGVQARGALTSQKSKNLARLYDRLSGLRKKPVPALAAKKELLSEWLSDAHPSFEGYFRTSSLDWRTFVLVELEGLGLPLRRNVRSLIAAQHLHLELTHFDCSEPDAAETGLPAFGVEACVFTFLSDPEQRGAVVCLGGIWRLLVELPRQQALPFGPVAQRPDASRTCCQALQRGASNSSADRSKAGPRRQG